MLIVEKITSPEHFSPSTRKKGAQNLGAQNWVRAEGTHTSFDIAHDGDSIYLHYYVHERQVRAVNKGYHSPVWEDSCVEFFFSLKGDEDRYYNFEFNAIGTILAAYGKDRHERTRIPAEILDGIETFPSLGREPLGTINKPTRWDLRIRIPREALVFNQVNDLSGLDGYANFYKCGDKLDHPHFLSWNPVLTEKPDFHTPRFFRHLSFL
ncbi:MAG: carbohydrate-binding family 9-like protein [Bacteroidales bacterium]